MQELLAIPGKLETVLSNESVYDELQRAPLPLHRFPVPGTGRSLPDRAGGRAEAEGDLVHPRGGLSGRRNEARAERADRREAAGGGAGHARSRSRESHVLYEKTLSNIQEVKAREGIVLAIATEGDQQVIKTADYTIELPVTSELLTRSWRWCRCNCWRTTSRCAADAMWISRAIWRRA